MPRKNYWELEPMSLRMGGIAYSKAMDEQRQTHWDSVKNLEISGLDIKDYGKAGHFFDPTTNEWMYGMMDIDEAFTESMRASYVAGITSRNAGASVVDAQNMTRGREGEKFKGTILEMSQDGEDVIADWLNTSGWNMVAMGQGGKAIPLVEQLYDPPDMLLTEKGPEGWSIPDALALLEEKSPENYLRYSAALGGEEAMKEILQGAKNPAQFWWKLNSAVQQAAFTNVMSHWDKGDPWYSLQGLNPWSDSYRWKFNKSFFVNGILNDPDMAFSLGLGTLLNVFTAGTVGTAVITAKMAQKATQLSGVTRRINRIANMGKAVRGAQGVVKWLPENLPINILEMTLYKNLAKTGFLRWGATRVADAAEGLFSGAAAEIFNQYRQIRTDKIDQMNWGHVGTEAWYEMVFTPFINPMMRFALNVPGWTSKKVFKGAQHQLAIDMVGPRMYNLIQDNFSQKLEAGKAVEAMEHIGQMRQKFANATGIDFSQANMEQFSSLGEALSLIQLNQKRGQEDGFETNILEIFDTIAENSKGVVDDVSLAIKMVEEWAVTYGFEQKLGQTEGLDAMLSNLRGKLNLNKLKNKYNADNNTNLTLEEHNALLMKEGNFLASLDAKDQLMIENWWKAREANKDKDFKALTAKEQSDVAAAWAIKMHQEASRVLNEYEANRTTRRAEFIEAIEKRRKRKGERTRLESREKRAAEQTNKVRVELNQATLDAKTELENATDAGDKEEAQRTYDDAVEASDSFNARNPITETEAASITQSAGTAAREEAQALSNEYDQLNEIADQDMTDAQDERSQEIWNILVNTDGTTMAFVLEEGSGRERMYENANMTSHEGRIRIVQLHKVRGEGTVREEVVNKVREEHFDRAIPITEEEIWEGMQRQNELDLEEDPTDTDLFVKEDAATQLIKNKKLHSEREEQWKELTEIVAKEDDVYGATTQEETFEATATELDHMSDEALQEDEMTDQEYAEKLKLESLQEQEDIRSKIATEPDAEARNQLQAELEVAIQDTLDIQTSIDEFLAKEKQAIETLGKDPDILPLKEDIDRIDTQLMALKRAMQENEAAKNLANNHWAWINFLTPLQKDMYRGESDLFAKEGDVESKLASDETKDMAKEWIDGLPDLPNKVDPDTKQQISGTTKIKNLINNRLLRKGKLTDKALTEIHAFVNFNLNPHLEEQVNNTEEAKQADELQKEKEKLWKPYRQALAQEWLKKSKNNRELMLTIQSLRQVVKQAQSIKNGVKVRDKQFTQMLKDAKRKRKKSFTHAEMHDIVYPLSEHWARVRQDYAMDEEKYKNKTYTITEAKKLVHEARTEALSYANSLKQGMSRYVINPVSMESFTKLFAHEVDEDYALELDSDIDDIIESSNIGLSDEQIGNRDVLQESILLDKFYGNLQTLIPKWQGREIPAFLIQSASPKEFDTLFVTVDGEPQPLGILSLFERHVIRNEKNQDKNPLELSLEMNRTHLDFDGVLKSVRVAMLKHHVGIGKWSEALALESLDSIEASIEDEGGANSIYNIINTERVLKRFAKAQKILVKRLATEHGLVLKRDSHGFPIYNKKTTPDQYMLQVKKSMIARIEAEVERTGERQVLHKIKQSFPDWYARVFEDMEVAREWTLGKYLANTIYDKLRTNLDQFSPHEPFSIIELGDGTKDWQDAHTVGEALVDVILGKELVMKNPLFTIDPDQDLKGELDEYIMDHNPSVLVAIPEIGQTNRSAPVSPRDLFKNYQNFKFRKRIDAILKEDLTPAKKAKIKKWIKEVSKVLHPDKVGEEFKFGILPTIVGGSLEERMVPWDEMVQYYKEHMLELPQIGVGHIHDEMTARAGTFVSLKKEYRMQHPGISHGSSLTVPYGQIGDIMALEATWIGLDGMVDGAIRAVHTIAMNAPKRPDGLPDIYDFRNHVDRTFSGLMEARLISLAGIGEGATATLTGVNGQTIKFEVQELIDNLIDGTWREKYKDEIDYYKAAGTYIASQVGIRYDKGDQNTKNNLRTINDVFNQVLRDGKKYLTLEKWNEKEQHLKTELENIASFDTTNLAKKESLEFELKKLKAMRNFFKIPVMRRLYQGGMGSWNSEFDPLNFRAIVDGAGGSEIASKDKSLSDGVQALAEIENIFGVKFQSHEITALGEAMFKGSVDAMAILIQEQMADTKIEIIQDGLVIDAAVGLPKGTKANMMAFLRMDAGGGRPITNMVDGWLEKVRIWSENKDAGLDEAHPLYNADVHEQAWVTALDEITRLTYGINKENPKWDNLRGKVETQYEPRLAKARAYLKTLTPDQRSNMHPESPHFKELEKIMYGGNEKLYKSNGYLRALNAKNRTALQINVTRMRQAAEYLGFADFDEGDFMGLGSMIIYHTAKPTVGSKRAYDMAAGYGQNLQGAFFERIAKDPHMIDPADSRSIFAIEAKKLPGNRTAFDLTIQEKREIMADYMLKDSDNLDSLGMHDIVNNPYYGNKADGTPKYTKEQFDEEIDTLMYKNLLAQYATYDKPPLESYTAEDTAGEIEAEWLDTWSKNTELKKGQVVEEKAQEADWLARRNEGDVRYGQLLLMKAKTNRIYNPEVARALGVPLATYAKKEYTIEEIYGQTIGEPLKQQTTAEIGPMSMQPKYKKTSFHDRGIFFLQQLQTSKLRNEVVGDVKVLKALAEGKIEFDPLIDPSHFGYAMPISRESLPLPMGAAVDWTQNLDPATPEGVEAIRMLKEVQAWAVNRGYWEIIENNPLTFPYFYQLRKYEKIKKDTLNRLGRLDRQGIKFDPVRASGTARIDMLMKMHNTSYLSRDLRKGYRKGQQWSDKGHGIATPEGIQSMEQKIIKDGGKHLTWEEFLTSPISENNPYGYTLDRTLVHEAIEFGIIDRDGITLEGRTVEDDPTLFKFTDLHLVSSTIQAHDFNKFLLSVLYHEYIQKIIHSDAAYAHLIPFAGNPNTWDLEFSLDEKIGLSEAAKAQAMVDQIQIEINIPSQMIKTISKHDSTHDKVNLQVLLDTENIKVTKRTDGTTIDISQGLRNTFYGQGFSIETIAPREVKGGYTLALSSTAALEMFTLLENASDIGRAQLSFTLDKNIDSKLSDAREAKMIRSRTDAEHADRAFGHTMDKANKRTVLESEAMQAIARALGAEKSIPTIKSGKNQTRVDGQRVDIVDLDSFKRSVDDGVSDVVTESYIAPIRAVLGRVRRTGVSSLVSKKLDKIEALIDAVKFDPANREYRTKLILLSIMFMEGTPKLDSIIIDTMLNKNLLPSNESKRESLIQRAHDEAAALYRGVAELAHHESMFHKQPLMQFAREFAWQSTDVEVKDNQTFRDNWINKVRTEEHLRNLVPTGHINVQQGNLDMDQHAAVDAQIVRVANIAMDFALAEQSEDAHNYEAEWFGNPALKDINVIKIGRTHNGFMEFADSAKGSPYLRDIGQRILEMTQTKDGKKLNYLSSNEAAIVRSYVLRMHTYNPMSLSDIKFSEEALLNNMNLKEYSLISDHSLGRATRHGKGDYGLALSKELQGKHYRAMDVIMHELSHIATFKFVDSSDTAGSTYGRWMAMYKSKKGGRYLRKMVEYFHGGRSAHTEQLITYYMSHEKEFVAAMVHYSLLNDIDGAINETDWTAFDNEIHLETQGLVGRITQFIRKAFGRLSSVFSNWAKDDPRLLKSYQLLVERTLGWDRDAGRVIEETVNPAWMEGDYQGERSFPRTDKAMGDAEFRELVVSHTELSQIKEQMGEEFDQMNEWLRLDGLLADHGGDKISIGSMTRKDYVAKVIELQNRYPSKKGNMFDLIHMMNDQANTDEDYEAALQYIMDQVVAIIGDPMTANTALIAKKLIRTFGMSPYAVKNFIVDLQVGPTGAMRTWAAPTIFQRLLSALLDDKVVMTARQLDNRGGMPSVTRGLGELEFVGMQMDAFNKQIAAIARRTGAFTRKEGRQRRVSTLAALQREFIHKVDDPDYEIRIPEEVLAEDQKVAFTVISEGSKAMRMFLEDLVDRSDKIGLHGKGFKNLIPLRFNHAFQGREDLTNSFESLVRDVIYQKIKSNASGSVVNDGTGLVDAATLYMSGQMPSIRSNQYMVNDMIRMTEDGAPAHMKGLVHHFMHQVLGENGTDTLKHVDDKSKEGIADYINSQIRQLGTVPGERTVANADIIIDLFKTQLVEFIGNLQIGRITWGDLGSMSGTRKNWVSQYNQALESSMEEEVDPILRGRMMDLSTENIGLPKHIFFQVDSDSNSYGRIPNSERGIQGVIDLHYHNLHSRADRGLYFPNNAWAVPNFSEMASHPEADSITPALMTNPAFIVKQFKKSFGDQIIETKMFRDHFGVHTDMSTLLQLSRKVFIQTKKVRHPDGSDLKDHEMTSLNKGIDQLMGKHDFIRGVENQSGDTNDFGEWLIEMAPSITKIAFGGNLATASLIVEGGFNSLVEAVGMRSFGGAIRSIGAVFLPMSPKLRREFAGDLIAQIEAVTQGHVPDFQKPSRIAEETFFKNAVHNWGRAMMYPAKHALTGIAMSRAITLRRSITRLWRTEGLKRLNDYLLTNTVTNPAELKGAMKAAGISSRYTGIVKLLIQGGLFTSIDGSGDFNQLDAMFKRYAINDEKYYGLNTLLTKITTDKSTSTEDYGHKLRVLSKLRYAEKEFIEQVLISPNAFDITTAKKGQEIGVMDAMMEIFRRYPMLFSSQKFLRAGNEMTIAHFGLQLVSLLILDSIYMMALQIAAGTAFEDIIESWEKDPVKNGSTMLLRFPIMGRYLPFIGELLKQLVEGSPARQHLIPLSGLANTLENLASILVATFTSKELTGDEWMNALRNLPGIGDTLVKLSYHAAVASLGAEQRAGSRSHEDNMSQFRERGGNFGMTEGMKEQTAEWWTGKVFQEFFGKNLMDNHENDIRQNPMFKQLTEQPSPAPQAAPEAPAPQAAPQPAEAPDPIAALEAQEGVSSKLADRLPGAR